VRRRIARLPVRDREAHALGGGLGGADRRSLHGGAPPGPGYWVQDVA
jgi:hypothetical protein